MANLAQLEELFWRAVRSDRVIVELDAVFVGNVELSARRRLGIYRSAYWARQERVLADTFPVVRAIMGEQRFRRVGLAYLRRHPSQHPAIEWIGRRFPDALGSCDDLPAYLQDVAHLEWTRLEVLLAPANAVATLNALCELDFASAHAELCSNVRVLQLSQQALRAWRDRVAPSPQEGRQRVACLVWRQQHQARHRVLDHEEQAALELLRGGHDFGHICSVFADPGAAERAAGCIGRWIQTGLLSKLGVSQSTG